MNADELVPDGLDGDEILRSFLAESGSDGSDGETEDPPQREPWKIDGESSAIWVGRKWSEAFDRVAEFEELYQRERERLDDWLSAKTGRDRQTIEFFGASLARWHEDTVRAAKDEGRKVAGGCNYGGCYVSTMVRKPSVVVTNEQLAAPALLRMLDRSTQKVVEPRPKVVLGELRKRFSIEERAVTEAGEIVTRDPASRKKWPPTGANLIEPRLLLDGVPVETDVDGVGITPETITTSEPKRK